jgi:hypothetical protein
VKFMSDGTVRALQNLFESEQSSYRPAPSNGGRSVRVRLTPWRRVGRRALGTLQLTACEGRIRPRDDGCARRSDLHPTSRGMTTTS